MRDNKIKRLVIAAMFAAITCVATMVIQIPSPMQGYLNLGECFVLLSGWYLGPIYGTASAALGSMMADVFTGYGFYAPGTLVIKGLVALTGYMAYAALSNSTLHEGIKRGFSALIAETVMVAGYFGYAALLLGNGFGALSSVPGNILQGVLGIASATALAVAISKNPLLKGYMER